MRLTAFLFFPLFFKIFACFLGEEREESGTLPHSHGNSVTGKEDQLTDADVVRSSVSCPEAKKI